MDEAAELTQEREGARTVLSVEGRDSVTPGVLGRARPGGKGATGALLRCWRPVKWCGHLGKQSGSFWRRLKNFRVSVYTRSLCRCLTQSHEHVSSHGSIHSSTVHSGPQADRAAVHGRGWGAGCAASPGRAATGPGRKCRCPLRHGRAPETSRTSCRPHTAQLRSRGLPRTGSATAERAAGAEGADGV